MSHEEMKVERQDFWAALSAAAPELAIDVSPGWEKEIPLSADGRVKIKMSLSQDRASVYLVARSTEAAAWITQNLPALAEGLRTVPGTASVEATSKRWFRKVNKIAVVTLCHHWPEAIRWLRAEHQTYSSTIRRLEKP